MGICLNSERLTHKITFFLILWLHHNKPYLRISPRTKAVPT